MTYTPTELALMMNAQLNQQLQCSISTLIIDSRMVFNPAQSLFFALKGSSHDGHSFIPELYRKGVRNFVVQHKYETASEHSSANFYRVSGVLTALQKLASAHRRQFCIPILAITGSNGKTVVKEWLAQIIGNTEQLVRSPRSYNSQAGVPLSVWQLDNGTSLAIFEAGISQPNEMEHLEKIISPTCGMFTNLGTAHQQDFDSPEHKLDEKLQLFKNADTLFYCKDHALIDAHIRHTYPNRQLVTWGRNSEASLHITSIAIHSGTLITALWRPSQQPCTWHLPFEDAASIENALHSLLFLLWHGYSPEWLNGRLQMLQPVGMRMEQKQGIEGSLLINDSYNSDLTSLEVAIDFLNQQGRKKGMKRTLILSDMQQSGIASQQLYPKVAELIKTGNIHRMIGVGSDISSFAAVFDSSALFFNSTAQLLAALPHLSFAHEAILIKGARSFQFEQIVSQLETTRHSTVLEINLNALINNLNIFRSHLNAGTKVLAMVKAFGYGSGSYEIAGALQHHKVDCLGVAFADEGIELRRAGIALPIIVMNPDESSFGLMPANGLEPEIYSFSLLHSFNRAMEREGLNSIPVHLKIDTGMNRLGFSESEINQLVDELQQMPCLKVQSVFSHLAASDAPEHDNFTHQQITTFTRVCNRLETMLRTKFCRHILNSAGIQRFPQAQFDMVRLGIGLYGIGTSQNMQLQNVATLKTTVSQVKNVPAQQSIGYGRAQYMPSGGTVAVIPIGYADGLNRHLSCGTGKVLIHDRLAPIVGNICMDMCMIDISSIPGVKEGDEVIIFGDSYPPVHLAQQLNTIPYEILTSIGRRVKRIYFKE